MAVHSLDMRALRAAVYVVILEITLGGLGCGGRPEAVDSRGMAPVFEFATRSAYGHAFTETAAVDVGAPSFSRCLVSGWGRPEVDPKSEVNFVWAVASQAAVDTFLLHTDYRVLDVRCWPLTGSGAPEQRVDVLVNGVALGSLELKHRAAQYSLIVPRRVLQPGRNRIDFHFARVDRPSDLVPGSRDNRTLAAAFDFVGFRGAPLTQRKLGPPEVRNGSLYLRRGTGVSYVVETRGEVVLDLGLDSKGGLSDVDAVIWIRRGNNPKRVVYFGPTGQVKGERWSHRIEPGEGMLEIGFGSPAADGDSDDAGELVLLAPQLLSTEGGDARPSNLLLIVVDTLRADHVGVYGAETPTPNMDALAGRGVRFASAYSHIPITGPSHATLFTSRLPFETGVHNNGQTLAPGFQTMADTMSRARRMTAAVVSLGVLKGRFGFARGFSTYLDDFGYDWMKNAMEINAEVFKLVDGVREPYFMWVHYSDPHEPYTPPSLDYPSITISAEGRLVSELPTDGRGRPVGLNLRPGPNRVRFALTDGRSGRTYKFTKLRVNDPEVELSLGKGWTEREKRVGFSAFQTRLPAELDLVNPSAEPREVDLTMACKLVLTREEQRKRYALEVAYVDRQIGLLLADLERRGLLEKTLVVFTADHGESLGEHDHVGHISQLYDTLLHVPLIFSFPGRLQAGRVVDAPVGLVDVLPTVAELLGLEAPAGANGRSLVGLMDGAKEPPHPVFAATYRPEAYSEKRAVVLDGFKYIHSWTDDRDWVELYDLSTDPEELNDLADSRPDVVERLRSILDARLGAANETVGSQADLGEDDLSELRALGYVH